MALEEAELLLISEDKGKAAKLPMCLLTRLNKGPND
jgi:hypothetical protein